MTDFPKDIFPADIFTERDDIDADTLANLGPLRAIAGVWRGEKGLDVNPFGAGERRKPYYEQIELQPCDPQSNGPQLFYGLRYHAFIKTPDEDATYHDQVGYWLWEPATGLLVHTLTIPRGQTVLATGRAAPDAKTFEAAATRGATENGICSNPFLEQAFRTDSFRIAVTVHDDGAWSYAEDTVLMVRGRTAPFHHTDANTLTLIAPPTPNPLMRLGSAAP